MCYTATNLKKNYQLDSHTQSKSFRDLEAQKHFRWFREKPDLVSQFRQDWVLRYCSKSRKEPIKKAHENQFKVSRFVSKKVAGFLRNVLPQSTFKTIVNGSRNFTPLDKHSFNSRCPNVKYLKKYSLKKQARIFAAARAKTAPRKPKPSQQSYSKQMTQFWWPYSSFEEAKEKSFQKMTFGKRHIHQIKQLTMRRRNNLRLSRLLALVGERCTFTSIKYDGGVHLELCNLHYIRTYQTKSDPRTNGRVQTNNQFFGIFNDDIYWKNNEDPDDQSEGQKVHIWGQEKPKKARINPAYDSVLYQISKPEPLQVRAEKRYINGLARYRFSLKKMSNIFQRLYTKDFKLFVSTFQEIRFKLQKHDFSPEETQNVLCFWICGLLLDRLHRSCARALPACEKRRDRIISRTASIRDQLFMKEEGEI